MKKPKAKKYPRKPKASASVMVKTNYVSKCRQIDKDNRANLARYNADKKKNETLNKTISKIGRAH